MQDYVREIYNLQADGDRVSTSALAARMQVAHSRRLRDQATARLASQDEAVPRRVRQPWNDNRARAHSPSRLISITSQIRSASPRGRPCKATPDIPSRRSSSPIYEQLGFPTTILTAIRLRR